MTVIRWILGIVLAGFAGGCVLSFAMFIGIGEKIWSKRAAHLKRLTTAVAMFWFNLEIWRRVALIIIHW